MSADTLSELAETKATEDDTLPHPFSVRPNCELLVSALKSHTAEKLYELSFQAGAFMRVINRDRSDFWRVEMKGAGGWAPTTAIQLITPEQFGAAQVTSLLNVCQTSGHPSVRHFNEAPLPVCPRLLL